MKFFSILLVSLAVLLLFSGLAQSRSPSVWRNHGKDSHNSRHQPDSTINKQNVENIQLFNSFIWQNISGYPAQGSVSCTPSIWGNDIYYGDFNGNQLSVNKLNGQFNFWEYVPDMLPLSTRTGAFARSTPALNDDFVYIGTTDGSPSSSSLSPGPAVIRMDKDGSNVISRMIDNDPSAIITQSGTSYDGSYYVGISSQQSLYAATVPNYVCCTSQGKFFKLDSDLNTLWEFETIQGLPVGTAGYSGASVWGSSPVILEDKEMVVFTTGQNHNLPQYVKDCLIANPTNSMACWEEGNYADSVIALNSTSGEMLWHYTTRVDAWNVACLDPTSPNYSNCPIPTGPDGDFGMGIIRVESPYEECEKVCECAKEYMQQDIEEHNTILDKVDSLIGFFGRLFSNSDSSDQVIINNGDSSSSSTVIERGMNLLRKDQTILTTIDTQLEQQHWRNCDVLKCPKVNYDCKTCYPYTDASDFAVVSTRGLYSFDSMITGSVALEPVSNLYGVPPTIITGSIEINTTPAFAAHQDMLDSYTSMIQCPCDFSISGDLNQLTSGLLVPGVYCINGHAYLNNTLTVANNNPGGFEYTFLINGNLTFYPGAMISSLDSADRPCNINWIANRIIVEQTAVVSGNFISRDDIVLFKSQLFGRVFTIAGPVITYESEISLCKCLYIQPSSTPTSTSTSTSSSTASSSSSTTPIPSPSSSTSSIPSVTPSTTSLPSFSSTPSAIVPPSSTPSVSASNLPTTCSRCPLDQILSSSYIVSAKGFSNVGLSVLTGNVGTQTPITGFPPGIILGSVNVANANANIVQNEVTLMYNNYVNCLCTDLGNANLVNSVISPGHYCYDSLSLNGSITFVTNNDPTALFVIVANQIDIDDGTIMAILGDGLFGCNVIIISKTTITVGTLTTLVGTMIAQSDISYTIPLLPIAPQALLNGHLFSINGNVLVYNVLATLCSCKQFPSISATPSRSPIVLPSPSPSPVPPCVNCPQNDYYKSYAVLSKTLVGEGVNTLTGNLAINGSLFGFPPSVYTGSLENNTPQTTMVSNSVMNMFTTYTSCPCTQRSSLNFTSSITYTPGVYCYTGPYINYNDNSVITIDVTSNPTGLVIIRARRIVFFDNVNMVLIGGNPDSCNVFFIADDPIFGVIQINRGANLFGTFIATLQISMPTSNPNIPPINSNIRGHLFCLTGNVFVYNLIHTLCSCEQGGLPSSTPTRSILPSVSSSSTMTPTCTVVPPPEKKCDCNCDIHGVPHVPMHNMIVVADKDGNAYGLNEDTGIELWKTKLGPGGTLGGSSWGGATDEKNYVYYNIINNESRPWSLTPSNEITTEGGWVKVDVWTGEVVWAVKVPVASDPSRLVKNMPTGAPTLVNDVLVTTSTYGYVYFIDVTNGQVVKMVHDATTIYGGVSADSNNCVYVGTGYSSFGYGEGNGVLQYCVGTPESYN